MTKTKGVEALEIPVALHDDHDNESFTTTTPSPTVRLEIFENGLRDLLCGGDLPSGNRYAKVAELLHLAWSPTDVRLTYLSVDRPHFYRWPDHGANTVDLQSVADDCDLRLLEIAAQKQQILWVRDPFMVNVERALGALSTSFGEQIVIELRFDSANVSAGVVHRDAVLVGFEHSLELLNRFGSSLLSIEAANPTGSQRLVDAIAMELMQQRRQIRERISQRLAVLQGTRHDSLAGNQSLAQSIHRLLDENGLRVECPTCFRPAILRCLKAGNCATGSFVFDHRVNGRRTMHGGRSDLPHLIVLDKSLIGPRH